MADTPELAGVQPASNFVESGGLVPDQPDTIPAVSSQEDYDKLPHNAQYRDPEGNVRNKQAYQVANEKDYHAVPEGGTYVDPEGNERQKPEYQPLSFSAQTMYSMAVTPKEKRKVLEKFYGKGRTLSDLVTDQPGNANIVQLDNGEFVVDDNGTMRAPGKMNSIPSAAGVVSGNISPVAGGILGGIAAAPLGGAPAAGGAALGTMGGQYFNDIILKLNGLYDRTPGEDAADKAIGAGSSLAGDVAGRGVAAFVPSVKAGVSNVSNAAPKIVNKFLGTEKAGPGAVTQFREISELGEKPSSSATLRALGMTESDTTPGISTIAKDSPHLQNVQEVFHEAFDTSQPRQRAAEAAYNKMGAPLLEKQGIGGVDDLVSSTPAVSVQKTGEKVIAKALEQSGEIDARFAAELAARRETAAAGVAEAPAQREAILGAARAQQDNASKLINAGLQEVEHNANEAVRAAAQGTNSGDLWQAVGQQVQQLRTAMGARYRETSRAAYQTAPLGAQIDTAPISSAAQDFMRDLPEEFRARFPALIRNIEALGARQAEGEAVPALASLEQLHNIRSELRSQADWYDLPSSFKNGTLKYFAHQVDNLMQSLGHEGSPYQTAIQMLNENDRWFAAERPVFNAKEMQTVLRGLEAGEPADPEQLFKALVRPGSTDLIARTEQVVGPNLWNGVRAAQRQQWLRNAREGQFDRSVNAVEYAKEVLAADNAGTLKAVQGEQQGNALLQQAQQIAMLNGKLPVDFRPNDTAFDVFRQARLAMDAAEREANVDPLKTLTRETRRIEGEMRQQAAQTRRADPLRFLTDKSFGATRAVNKILGDEDLILASAARFGEKSPEFDALRQVWTERVFRGTLEPGKRLEKASPEVQRLMMGVNLETAQKLAEDMSFIMGGKTLGGGGNLGGSLSATAKVEHPVSRRSLSGPALMWAAGPIGRYGLGKYFSLMNKLLESPATARWLEKAYTGGEAHRNMVRQELSRILNRGGAIGAGAAQGAYQLGND
jgi:hypothetical protein